LNDLEDFRRRVGRNDYELHKYGLWVAAAGVALGFALGLKVFLGVSGGSLLASGIFALRGGKSAVAPLTHADPEDLEWGIQDFKYTLHELDQAPPGERFDHAQKTGIGLVVVGLVLLIWLGMNLLQGL